MIPRMKLRHLGAWGTVLASVAVVTLSGAPAAGPVKFEAHDIDPKLAGAYAVNTADFNNDGKST